MNESLGGPFSRYNRHNLAEGKLGRIRMNCSSSTSVKDNPSQARDCLD